MRFVWLNVALGLACSGCFGSHGMDGRGTDAGPAPGDGGGDVDAGPAPRDAGPVPSDAGPALGCYGQEVSEAIVPRVLLSGQPLSMTLRASEVGGCSCTPHLVNAEPLSFGMEVCDCCELCACIDFGYEVGHVGAVLPVGDHELDVGGEERAVSVRASEACHEATPLSMRIEAPHEGFTSTGPRLHWAVVETEEAVCCVEPLVAVAQLDIGVGVQLQPLSCTDPDPCDCDGEPTRVESWYPLGELGSGTYSVRAGDHEATFTVP